MPLPHLDKQIVLRKHEDRRVLGGHPWVFSNEVREIKGNPAAGDVVELQAASGLTLGIGFFHPHSLICFRLLSPGIEPIDAAFFRSRISAALTLRQKLYPGAGAVRLVHGEADFLPGLTIDRFNDLLSVQTASFGMDARLPVICDVLDELLHPAGIVERNESSLRLLEQLPQKKGILRGNASPTEITEHGLRYRVDVLQGQKTGYFLDQRENRAVTRRYAQGARVLDCFCNEGGFALNAAAGGAASVVGIDVSQEAVAAASGNALLNQLPGIIFEQGDVFERLDQGIARGETYDLVILDPPSFAKSRKTIPAAKKGYRELNMHAMRLLAPGGILMTASCSHHLDPEVFLAVVNDAAGRAGRRVQLLDWRGAAPDHPTLPAVPETRYLKFGVFAVGM